MPTLIIRILLVLTIHRDYPCRLFGRFVAGKTHTSVTAAPQPPSSNSTKDSAKALVFSLDILDDDHVHGLVRNILLAERYLHQWNVYVYINTTTASPRILDKLRLTAPIRIINTSNYADGLASSLLPYTAGDDQSVSHVIVRNVLNRLSQRDADVINDWLKRNDVILCVRDHPVVHDVTLIPGLVGFKTKKLLKLLNSTFTDSLLTFSRELPSSKQTSEAQYLNEFVLPRVQDKLVCYDSVHCDSTTTTLLQGERRTLPSHRANWEFLGEYFTAFEVPQDFNASVVFQGASGSVDKC